MEQKRMTAAEALEVINTALSSIDHTDRALLSAQERVALMSEARRTGDRFTSFTSVLTDEVAQNQSSMAATGTPLTTLIGMDEGRDTTESARQIFDARDLNHHSAVREAALNGQLSPRHAVAITKGMAQLPPELTPLQKQLAEQAFIARAPKNTAKRLADLAPQVLAEIAPELAKTIVDDDEALVAQRHRAVEKRALSWGDDGDGSTWFRGLLPHLEAAPLIAVIQAYVESDRRAERDRLISTRATQPHPQIIREQVVADNHRTPDQRRADALTQLVGEHRAAPTSIGDRPRIVITIREQDLRDRAEKAGVLPRGAKITAGDLRRLCCDADLMPAVLGGPSELLDVGRTHRLVTPAIRRALTLRDGGCIFPNCTTPDTSCEAHHITPWWAGGTTALSNMALLCPHHHKLVEPDRYQRPGDRWTIHIDRQTGQPVITPPDRTERFISSTAVACTAAARSKDITVQSTVIGTERPARVDPRRAEAQEVSSSSPVVGGQHSQPARQRMGERAAPS